MCESPGAAQIVLEAKFLPCKEGEGSESGPKLCVFAQQRHAGSAEHGWSCAGVLWAHRAPAALPCWQHTMHSCQLPFCSLMEQSMQQWIKIGPFFQGQRGGLSRFCRASTVPG